MLPFLQPKKIQSVIMAARKPEGSIELQPEEAEASDLEMAAEELIRAVHAKDVKAVTAAIQACFELCDAMPHVEGEHV